MPGYILYKHPIQDDTQAIVRYCHHKGYLIMPCVIYERHMDIEEEQLPAIYDADNHLWYYGINDVVKFYRLNTGLGKDLLERALAFSKRHPNYQIHHPTD